MWSDAGADGAEGCWARPGVMHLGVLYSNHTSLPAQVAELQLQVVQRTAEARQLAAEVHQLDQRLAEAELRCRDSETKGAAHRDK